MFTACGDSNSLSHWRFQFLMDTLVENSVIEKDEELAKTAIQKAFREIRRLEKIMNSIEGFTLKSFKNGIRH